MTLYIGVDMHARQQTLSYLDTSDGSTGVVELNHEREDIKEYYSQFQGAVIIGIEACGYTNWFEELIAIVFYAFDLLELNREDLRWLPLLKRKAMLKRILRKTKNNRIRFTDHVIGEGLAVFAELEQELRGHGCEENRFSVHGRPDTRLVED